MKGFTCSTNNCFSNDNSTYCIHDSVLKKLTCHCDGNFNTVYYGSAKSINQQTENTRSQGLKGNSYPYPYPYPYPDVVVDPWYVLYWWIWLVIGIIFIFAIVGLVMACCSLVYV